MRKILFVIVSAFLFVSCGGSGSKKNEEPQDIKIKPVSEKVQGPLGEYFEVVSKDYKVKKDYSYEVSIEFKRIAEGLPEPWTKGMEVGTDDGQLVAKFTYEFQDADGSVIAQTTGDCFDDMKAICALSVGASTTILVNIYDDGFNASAAQFKVGSLLEYHAPKPEESSASASSSESRSDEDLDEAIETSKKTAKEAGAMIEVLDALN